MKTFKLYRSPYIHCEYGKENRFGYLTHFICREYVEKFFGERPDEITVVFQRTKPRNVKGAFKITYTGEALYLDESWLVNGKIIDLYCALITEFTEFYKEECKPNGEKTFYVYFK